MKIQTVCINLIMTLLLFPQPVLAEIKQPTITLTGTGRVSAAPDMAIATLGVVREAKTAHEALTANNKAMAEVFTALKGAGIEEKDLQTSNFNIRPQYHYYKNNEKLPKITSYIVSNTLTVRIRDLKATGSILDLSVNLGVNSNGSLRFTNADTAKIMNRARENAIKDALQKAEIMTNAAGETLGRVLQISENNHSPRPRPMAMEARAISKSLDASVPIAGGENNYVVNVQMIWELE